MYSIEYLMKATNSVGVIKGWTISHGSFLCNWNSVGVSWHSPFASKNDWIYPGSEESGDKNDWVGSKLNKRNLYAYSFLENIRAAVEKRLIRGILVFMDRVVLWCNTIIAQWRLKFNSQVFGVWSPLHDRLHCVFFYLHIAFSKCKYILKILLPTASSAGWW